MSIYTLGVVILNWNDYVSTNALVHSIVNHLDQDLSMKIYLVDNGSTDNSVKELSKTIQATSEIDMELLETNANLGYARGNNVGIRKAIKDGCEYIAVLNNDAELEEPIFNRMIKVFKENADAGIVTLKILNPDHTVQRWCARTKPRISHRFIIYSPLNRLFRKSSFYKNHFVDITDKKNLMELELFSGAAFMIDARLMDEIGLFDENTFLYEEEIILTEKISRKNKKIYLDPTIYVVHQSGQSTKKIGLLKYRSSVESERYYLENYSTEKYLAIKIPLLSAFRATTFYLRKLTGKI
ncbi:glycosyltransferase family 2 protein [Bacillus sp. 165]|uniref:glycosyltransferase n=1 Tax=Bacillus sp. 165 TaxID=1529117 RepID=UPI001ADBD57F|nr:glycosyltransferase family 2 protein [Bacillus sp. 165]MBO9131522.1 glycosyltransferase family 2 protein [Bacillus sp. 165]